MFASKHTIWKVPHSNDNEFSFADRQEIDTADGYTRMFTQGGAGVEATWDSK